MLGKKAVESRYLSGSPLLFEISIKILNGIII